MNLAIAPVVPAPAHAEPKPTNRLQDVIVEYRTPAKVGPLPAGSTRSSLVLYPSHTDPNASQWINGRLMGDGDFNVMAHQTRQVGPVKRTQVDSDGYFLKGADLTSNLQAIADAVTGSKELQPYMHQPDGSPKEDAKGTVTFSFWRDDAVRERMQRTFPLDGVPAELQPALDRTKLVLDLFAKVKPDGTLMSLGDRSVDPGQGAALAAAAGAPA